MNDVYGQGVSFSDLLASLNMTPKWEIPTTDHSVLGAPVATTVLALRFADGVVMLGDRQATEGHIVAHRRIQKVFEADHFSAIAISGTAGIAIDLVRLFQTELEHYEKLEGTRLSLDGKATYLGRMVRQQLPLVFQGLVVVPLFCGYDEAEGTGRLYTFDVVGGRYEEHEYGATGSGARDAKAYLRSSYRADLGKSDALDIGMRALVAAAQEDTATGGPDLARGILPNVVTVTAEGFVEVESDEVAALASAALGDIR
ncbi:MAG: proteasome subunit beta [Gammaproteobacteria bacterium]|nr:proteasome subunit beta [Gammaproteobacteria bacterium]